jgi:hypothetical protein
VGNHAVPTSSRYRLTVGPDSLLPGGLLSPHHADATSGHIGPLSLRRQVGIQQAGVSLMPEEGLEPPTRGL